MRRTTRGAAVNRYLFGVVYKAMAAKTGRPADDIHNLMCQWFLPAPPDAPVAQLRLITTAVRHTRDLSPAAFTAFVDQVRLFARTFLQIETDDPDYWRYGPGVPEP